MPSEAYTKFDQSGKDILMLWQIHAEVARRGKGRRHRADVLNRAAIVFIAACWESYVEDAAREAFNYLLERTSTPDVFPQKVKTLAAKHLREAKDERRIWELAGSGWRNVLIDHRDLILSRWLRDFNTPKSEQVRTLFAEMLNLRDVTSCWVWSDMTSEQACAKLNDYISIRGNIAHRTKHDEVVHKNMGKDFLSHVVKLVEKTDKALAAHVQTLIKGELQ
ncbi:MAG TPA: HEPN domain-containing protein [Rubrobacter sp.]|nr:HEPN domain-containing protein [Rubrobacter sp.]